MNLQLAGEPRELIVNYVERWAQAHPLRNEPLFFTLEGEGVSPLQLAHHVAANTRLGLEHITALAEMAELQRIPLTQVLERMLRSVEAARVAQT